MAARIGRGMRAVAGSAAVLLALSACDAPVAGVPTAGPNPNQFAAKEAFGAAIGALAEEPFLRYAGKSGSDQVAVSVARTGAVYGKGDVDGSKLTIAVLNKKLFVKAGNKLWRGLGAKPNEISLFANKLTALNPVDLGFDPAKTLTPKEVARTLRAAVEKAESGGDGSTTTTTPTAPSTGPDDPQSSSAPPAKLQRKVERIKLDDGTEVYRIPVEQHYVDVTVAQPHRIAGTDIPLSDDSGVTRLLGEGAEATFAAPDEKALKTLYGALRSAATQVKTAPVLSPGVLINDSDGDLNCQIGGKCTAKIKVRNNSLDRPGLTVSRFDVTIKVTMSATGLGSRKCRDSATMRPNKSVSMSCTVDFALAPSYTPRSYPVRANWTTTAVGRSTQNTGSLRAELSKELTELLEEI